MVIAPMKISLIAIAKVQVTDLIDHSEPVYAQYLRVTSSFNKLTFDDVVPRSHLADEN